MKKHLTLVLTGLFAIGFTSCSEMTPNTRNGAIGGAVVGGLVGAQRGKALEGAAIGAGVGAAGGYAIDKSRGY